METVLSLCRLGMSEARVLVVRLFCVLFILPLCRLIPTHFPCQGSVGLDPLIIISLSVNFQLCYVVNA